MIDKVEGFTEVYKVSVHPTLDGFGAVCGIEPILGDMGKRGYCRSVVNEGMLVIIDFGFRNVHFQL